jgi:hypothetical protein
LFAVNRREQADSGPEARQAIATAVFARTDVLGFERMEYELTSDAIALGLGAALPAVFELRDQIGEFGRGERSRTAMTDLSVRSRRLSCAVVGADRWCARAR